MKTTTRPSLSPHPQIHDTAPTIYLLLTRVGNSFFFKFIHSFICLFLAGLGLCCFAWAFSSCGERGLLFVVVCGLLIAVASLVSEHGL